MHFRLIVYSYWYKPQKTTPDKWLNWFSFSALIIVLIGWSFQTATRSRSKSVNQYQPGLYKLLDRRKRDEHMLISLSDLETLIAIQWARIQGNNTDLCCHGAEPVKTRFSIYGSWTWRTRSGSAANGMLKRVFYWLSMTSKSVLFPWMRLHWICQSFRSLVTISMVLISFSSVQGIYTDRAKQYWLTHCCVIKMVAVWKISLLRRKLSMRKANQLSHLSGVAPRVYISTNMWLIPMHRQAGGI